MKRLSVNYGLVEDASLSVRKEIEEVDNGH